MPGRAAAGRARGPRGLAGIEFFQTDDTKWQIFYATGVLLLAILLMLVKL